MFFRKTRKFLIFFQASTLPSSLRETPGENALLLLLVPLRLQKLHLFFVLFFHFRWEEKQKGPFSPVVVRDCRGFFSFLASSFGLLLFVLFLFPVNSHGGSTSVEKKGKENTHFSSPPFLRRYGTGNDEGKTSYISASSFSSFSYIFFAREE